MTEPLPAYLSRYVIQPDTSCWLWTGAVQSKGYGVTSAGSGKLLLAHRVFWEFYRGKIPHGLTLDHLCRTRRCVNPAHLEPVTRKENTARGDSPTAVNKRRTHCVHGHPLTGDNLQLRTDGRRRCRQCNIDRARQWCRARAANPKTDRKS